MRKLLLVLSIGLFFAACSPNNVQVNEEIGKYFDSAGFKGTFALFDNGTGDFTIYNLNRYKDSAYSPASTFKVVHSLIALETGVVSDEKMAIQLDSAVTMETAFKNSIVPYYQEVARRIGRDTMQFWLDSLQYGNHTIGKSIDSFWLNNTIKLTPDEQLGIMKRLFFNQLPYQKRTHEIVKRMMLRESNANYQLSYKTGLTYRENLVIIDVRRETEYANEHVKEAINIPLDQLTDPGSMANLDDHHNIYIHCASGYRSVIAASMIKRQGIHNIRNVVGGIEAIKGLPEKFEFEKEAAALN